MKFLSGYFAKKLRYTIIFLSALSVVVFFQNCSQSSFQSRIPSSVQSQSLNSESDLGSEEFDIEGIDDISTPRVAQEQEPADELQSLATVGKIYYVSKSGNDTTGLSTATAFRTIQKAANIAKAGDTVMVLAGIYKEYVQNKNSGTATARIRFVSSPRWAAKLAPVKGAPAFWTSLGAYVTIEGFTLDGKLGGEIPMFRSRGIQVNGNASRVLYNNIRLYRACTTTLFYRTGVGIGVNGYLTNLNTEIVGNVIRNTRVVGCSLPPRIDKDSNGTYHFDEATGYGIYHATPKGKVYNNIISGFRIGIHLWHNPTDTVVSHNLIFNIGNLRQGYGGVGIVFGCGDSPYTTCKNIIVANNIFMNSRNTITIREYGRNVVGSNQILNNILYLNTSNSIVTVNKPKIAGNLINVNPKLVNFQLSGTGDYRLSSTSPAINKASLVGAVSKDINQGIRAAGKADIGPYEYGAAAPVLVNMSTANGFLVK